VPVFRHQVHSLKAPSDAQKLIRAVKDVRRKGMLELHMGDGAIYPNGAVPFAAAYDHFRKNGELIKVASVSPEVTRMRVLNPSVLNAGKDQEFLNVVWRYQTPEEANRLCTGFINALSESAECAPGVLNSLEWCIFEVLDNVFQHSGAHEGFAMMQIHRKNRNCTVTVSDTGIGIHRSFLEAGVHRSDDAYEAIKNAVQERVTSKTKNMGNGLFGLIRVVGIGEGQLCIQSGRGHMTYRDQTLDGGASFSVPVIDDDHHGTTVDWQVSLNREVTMQHALPASRFADVSLRLENLEDGEGNHLITVAELEEGVGARSGAEKVRFRLENLIKEGAYPLTLDFRGLSIVSSSFADEVLGKLALRMGLMDFMSAFRLVNLTPTVKSIVDRAIQQRLAEGDAETPARI